MPAAWRLRIALWALWIGIAFSSAYDPVPGALDVVPQCQLKPRYDLVAVIVVHKPCNTLLYTLNNFLTVLGREVPIIVRHNPGSLRDVSGSNLFRSHILNCRIFAQQLALPVTDIDSYSALLASTQFWDFPAEMVLTFQTDSALCAGTQYKISDFFRYSYVGAPWHHEMHHGLPVGNGGLSLRNQTVMRYVIENFPYDRRKRPPEDFYFVTAIAQMARHGVPGVVYPNGEQASLQLLGPNQHFH